MNAHIIYLGITKFSSIEILPFCICISNSEIISANVTDEKWYVSVVFFFFFKLSTWNKLQISREAGQ